MLRNELRTFLQCFWHLLVLFSTVGQAHNNTLAPCPRGSYKHSTSRECVLCPRGTYGTFSVITFVTIFAFVICAKWTTNPSNQTGETSGLNNNDCTAMCPMGTYGDVVGARTIDDCKKCPAGTFGMLPGLTTRRCSGVCPPGRYSKDEGLISLTACVRCPRAYYMWQCQEGQRQYTGKAVPARAHDSRGH
jgi:hypothetical protein